MIKELEALEEIRASHLQAHIDSKNIGDFDIWFDDLYNTIKQALTPPTAEEVCEALSEYFQTNVIYYPNFKSFGYEFSEEKKKYNIRIGNDELRKIYVTCYSGKIEFYIALPPHLIELIAKFYKKELGEK